MEAGPSSAGTVAKRRRVTRACDKCHDLGIKVSLPPFRTIATQLMRYQQVLAGLHAEYGAGSGEGRSTRRPSDARSTSASATGIPMSEAMGSIDPVNDDMILALVKVFYGTASPILVYFHWPTFWSDICSKRYDRDRCFYALTMAVCATACARVRDGAQLPPTSSLMTEMVIPASDVFHRACVGACSDMLDDGDVNFELMRTEAVLGMLCLQHNDVRGSHRHLHRYLGMSAEIGFHSETRWGSDLTAIDVEERRRLFWHQYHLDVQLAVTFGSSIRHREAQCNVAYPAEVYDDDDIQPDGVQLLPERGTSLIKGWNFVTDLYRILEHVINNSGVSPPTEQDTLSRIGLQRAPNMDAPHAQDILREIGKIYDDLPIEFKMPQEMTGDAMEDRYGFQAANILITMTTLKMILVGAQQDGIQQRCAVAGELLDGLSTIPEAYIRAASTAMLHHLAGVGHLLASVIKSPLSPWGYLQARSVLLALADLLAIFETSLSSDVKMSSKIRTHVERIDAHSQKAKGWGAVLGKQIGVAPKPLYPNGIRFQDDSLFLPPCHFIWTDLKPSPTSTAATMLPPPLNLALSRPLYSPTLC
ncbi:hypothetical protein EHS25_008974 [Saitozyma podzolica]|uniref:Xylanolytic transcriptional activator regulatory domain-containing protein n=1 Tax=Saitozyma podzolica TaxID=1890683 RepID=A0A427YKI7_9TREE|nr:hypothetical protein EHS25_008974 [Saitozyma podzolica]